MPKLAERQQQACTEETQRTEQEWRHPLPKMGTKTGCQPDMSVGVEFGIDVSGVGGLALVTKVCMPPPPLPLRSAPGGPSNSTARGRAPPALAVALVRDDTLSYT